MFYPLDDTITAIASSSGGGPRGIIRISGPATGGCLQSLIPSIDVGSLRGTTAFSADLEVGPLAPLPADVYFWPSARSYTGQPSAELHTLGSPPVLECLLEALCSEGARLAEPGEFTLRAFLSGRIDLTQAEGVLGTIDAVGMHQLDAALVQLAGGLAEPLHHLRETLLELLAHLEAGFDFADEELPFLESEELKSQLEASRKQIEGIAERMTARRESGSIVTVVLTGPPNAGKSSLFNALAADVGALVSDTPGTTRDYLCADLDLEGVVCRLIDTAGVGSTAESESCCIERAAQEIARRLAREAEVVLVCYERESGDLGGVPVSGPGADPLVIQVRTKADLADWRDGVADAVTTSVQTGEGLKELENRIREAVVEVRMGDGDVVVGTAVRCRESLRGAAESLERAEALAINEEGEELVAAEIRVSLDQVGHVVGAVCTDDLLDRIFSRFCIGK